MEKIGAFLLQRDIYGHQINMHYKGSDKYQTWMGLFCTLMTYTFVMFNAYALGTAFLDHSKQEEKSNFKIVDRFSDEKEYNLMDNNFEMQFVPSKELTPDVG